jgi:hypothetical protein
MTLIPTHTVPAGSLPLNAMKEELSKSYLHMVASAAGMTIGEWKTDYDGIDSTVKSTVDYAGAAYAPKIDIQLKSTGQESADRGESIAWSLETRTAAMLANRRRSNPALFCVLVSPAEEGLWLSLDTAGLLARSHMYWVWGHEFPSVREDQHKQVFHLPKENVLDPVSLISIMEEASKWQPTF